MEMLETLRRMQAQAEKCRSDNGTLTVDCYVNLQRKRLPITQLELYDRAVMLMNTSVA